MDFRAILVAVLLACFMACALVWLAILLAVSAQSVPQVMILFTLWALPGYYAAARAATAGTLHGLLSGLLGMIAVFFGMDLLQNLQILQLDPFNEKSPFGFIVLAGFWGSVGGMVADSVRLVKAKRALRSSNKRPAGSD